MEAENERLKAENHSLRMELQALRSEVPRAQVRLLFIFSACSTQNLKSTGLTQNLGQL